MHATAAGRRRWFPSAFLSAWPSAFRSAWPAALSSAWPATRTGISMRSSGGSPRSSRAARTRPTLIASGTHPSGSAQSAPGPIRQFAGRGISCGPPLNYSTPPRKQADPKSGADLRFSVVHLYAGRERLASFGDGFGLRSPFLPCHPYRPCHRRHRGAWQEPSSRACRPREPRW